MGDERRGIGNGILLVVIGVLFLLNQQGIAGFRHLWPLILIALGLISLLFPKDETTYVGAVAGGRGARRRPNRATGGFWLIMVGVIFLLDQNGVFRIHESWPLFIVAAGLAMIFSRRRTAPAVDDQTGGQS